MAQKLAAGLARQQMDFAKQQGELAKQQAKDIMPENRLIQLEVMVEQAMALATAKH